MWALFLTVSWWSTFVSKTLLDNCAVSLSCLHNIERIGSDQMTHCHSNMSSCYHCFGGFRGRLLYGKKLINFELWAKTDILVLFYKKKKKMSAVLIDWNLIFVFVFLLCSFIAMHLNVWPFYRRDWGHKNSSLETRKQHQLCVIA